MDEITDLLEQGRYKDIGMAADEFEFYIQEAMEKAFNKLRDKNFNP